MGKVKITASEEDVKKAGEDLGDFEVPKPGYYVVKLIEANEGYSKGPDGEEDTKRPRIECVYEIVGEGREEAEPKGNYGRLWDYIAFSKEAGWKRAEFVKAFYPDKVGDGALSVEIDTDELIERKVLVRVKHEKDKRKSEDEGKTVMRARISKVLPLDGADSFEAAEYDGDAFAGAEDEEEGTDPFSAEDEGGELLSREELEGYDLKELGSVAKEFDLDPTEFIVKVRGKLSQEKTKDNLIDAILDAQGDADPDEGGDEGDEEDPF